MTQGHGDQEPPAPREVDVDPDRAMVFQIQSGQDLAFDELMARYKKPVLNFIYRIVGNADDADDLAQDVFVRAYQNLPRYRFRPGTRFSTWLFQLARNAAIDHLRRRKHIFQPLENSETKFPGIGKTPASDFQALEIGAAIASAVAALPEDQRTALILAEYHDMSYAEIAAIMNSSKKSVESRLYRAKQELRDRLRHLTV
ncbi:MAG: sigma-70 family RNA polymerase sigma factor [bacterium]